MYPILLFSEFCFLLCLVYRNYASKNEAFHYLVPWGYYAKLLYASSMLSTSKKRDDYAQSKLMCSIIGTMIVSQYVACICNIAACLSGSSELGAIAGISSDQLVPPLIFTT